jgi:hypothetical protein
VASSKIEQIQANVDDYARALHGVRANSYAVAMAAATTALQAMIATVGPNAPIRLSAITSAHAALMHDDQLESSAAGELRTALHPDRRGRIAHHRATHSRKSPASGGKLTGPVRRGSAAAKILALLPGAPILSFDDAVALIDASRSSVFDAIGRLRDAGVLRALTDRRRNQISGAGLVLDEVDDLQVRIATAVLR